MIAFNPLWAKLGLGLAVLLVLTLVTRGIYSAGRVRGQSETQLKWDAFTKEATEHVRIEQAKVTAAEGRAREEKGKISDALVQSDKVHTAAVANIVAGYSERLRQSENRASVYKRQAQAGPAEYASLASHTAELDRALEEGRRLVGELRQTVEQRDEQLRLVGQQLLSDRKLISGNE